MALNLFFRTSDREANSLRAYCVVRAGFADSTYQYFSRVSVAWLTVMLVLQPIATQAAPQQNTESDTEPDSSLTFGERGYKSWYLQGAGAVNINDESSSFGVVGAGLSEFFANGHSINLELNSMYFSQSGDNAVGLNLTGLFRWHFYQKPNWTLFVDVGGGILGTTNKVPSGGSSFNFTPQAGGGATIRLDEDKQLFLGLRWHHISNADLYEDNPGRDSIMGYVGLSLPR